MATSPAATAPPDHPGPTRGRRAPWQAPVFLLGVGALVAAWCARPLWPDTPQRRLGRELAAARQALARPDSDPEQALSLARKALESADHLSERVGEAALLLGSAQVRRAESTSDPGRAAAYWPDALASLERARAEGVPEPDRPALEYRLAKVAFHTGADLPDVIRKLEATAAHADKRAEAYDLLTRAYLKLPQPDLARALEANRRLRDLPEATEEETAPAKLLAGELLLRLGKPDEARKTLELIGEKAPPALVARARLLRARSYQDEQKWGDATNLYESALVDAPAGPAEQARVYYDLGLCYRRLGHPEAVKAWQECLKLGHAPEAPAAALGLAEAYLAQRRFDKVLAVLTDVAHKVRKPGEWDNPLADLGRARDVFERAVRECRAAGEFERALQLASAYERLAVPVRAQVLRGELAAEWAQRRREKARGLDAERRRKEEQAARDLLSQAGEAFAQAARQSGSSPELAGRYLWTSATHYRTCGDDNRAAEQLKRFLALKPAPPEAQLGEACYRLGEAYERLRRQADARSAYARCLEYQEWTRFAYLARYRLAEFALEAGELDNASEILTQNLRELRWGGDPEALEKTLFALGGLLYRRREYRQAARRLEEALGRFGDNPAALKARYQLADSYRQIAAQENQSFLLGESMAPQTRGHFQSEHRRWLEKAAAEFATLGGLLRKAKEGADGLTREQRTQVPFIEADCLFNLGKYAEALALYEELAKLHNGRPEGIRALGGAVKCHAGLWQADKVRQRLLQIRQGLGVLDEVDRKAWDEWVTQASQGLGDLETAP
jgi:TolA-binding protein